MEPHGIRQDSTFYGQGLSSSLEVRRQEYVAIYASIHAYSEDMFYVDAIAVATCTRDRCDSTGVNAAGIRPFMSSLEICWC